MNTYRCRGGRLTRCMSDAVIPEGIHLPRLLFALNTNVLHAMQNIVLDLEKRFGRDIDLSCTQFNLPYGIGIMFTDTGRACSCTTD